MKEKSKVLTKVKEFKKDIEGKIRMKIQCLRSDNGEDYTSNEFVDFLLENGIRRQMTCPNKI